ncbi:lipin family protein [Arabidopsis lyrata subsp. lyrata]|uniref:phosphatidate phosphatase n=1 Tax=Arabidopsis lyrata subsp. lyrata TaxID=81972 RepID=D7L899_ARALL|nr:phosphatidate phosphatase PAH1 [Arabidopsis lyrata subsp. lyrata]EFH61000.1 lipin family protein [Arabidopsis lyrata subsp. lyrata]|eukprot:XP_002884741.1 phosphatidate phosphatase PAH1 [Arabidopsis lyrata subsp. lyrata]
MTTLVGRVGNLISQGVYSVATPFHPFGGAIDVIVVQQQDGSFRSTPWYVRFGKFQGVLKGAEKFVKISVNGTEADFHMYLDNSGEAYFIREVDPANNDTNSLISGSENNNGNVGYRLEHSLSDSGAGELREGFESLNRLERTESDCNRRFYDFQDDPPSPTSEYGSARFDNLNVESYGDSQGSDSEVVLVSIDGHILTAPVSAAEQEAENLRLNTPQFHLAPGDGTEFCEGNTEFASSETPWDTEYIAKVEESSDTANIVSEILDTTNDERNDLDSHDNAEKDSHDAERDILGSCLEQSETGENAKSGEPGSTFEDLNLKEGDFPLSTITENDRSEDEVTIETVDTLVDSFESSTTPVTAEEMKTTEESRISVDFNADSECKDEQPRTSAETAILINNQEGGIIESEDQNSERVSIDSTREEVEQLTPSKPTDKDNENGTTVVSVDATSSVDLGKPDTVQRYELSLCKDELRQGMGLSAAAEVFDAHRISMEEYINSATSILESENLVVRIRETYMPWTKAARIVLGKAVFDLDLDIQPDDVISVEENESPKPKDDETTITPSSSGRRWTLWPIPFRRVKTVEHTGSNSSSEEDLFVDSEPGLQNSPETQSTTESRHESPRRQLVRTNVPTNEQIASLNLKDGQNMITFSFSTRVLGTQQVDAHIYRWRWDTKIVISDVDGTITKSDVLGQFMPFIGKDWTQSGVAKLFSAIKENGYQLLFLSARAIVQAYLTRSFLNNLKQDGKALPNGPVVISPDGLFPALYREVIRRAPHEFKIACLEDIRKLFPTDYNPFYAGFGNRDTDELSYRKLGIPKGKIFIINPKGEVATGHRIDVKKSYTSLHTLVNDMFPPTSLVEQEDYNPWNFWKLPIEEVD